LFLTAGLHPARVRLENALLDGLLEDGLEQSVRVGLLGRGVLHPGVPRGDLGSSDVIERPVGPGWQDREAEQLRVERCRCGPKSSASHHEGGVLAHQKGSRSVTAASADWGTSQGGQVGWTLPHAGPLVGNMWGMNGH